jgi:trimeric autotransporter adhesin
MKLTRFFLYSAAIGLVMLAGIATSTLSAQTNYGSVRGNVTDAQAAAISGANVSLTNTGTQLVRTTTTNASGDYFFTAIDPGNYTIDISANGFKKMVRTGVVVNLELTTTVDQTLDVGTVGETVSVSATAAPLLDTSSASGGQIISEQQVAQLPNQGRNPFTVNKLDNNVTPVGDPRFVRYEDQNGTDSQSVSGAPIGANGYVVDGIPISTSTGGVTFVPAIEAVSEIKIQSNTYDAELGRTGGGIFNTSLKSGTDTYHGELFGLTRQNLLAANAWFNNHYGIAKPNYTTYQYAGAFGGPPPFSNKSRYLRNTFFWVTEAGYRQAQPLVSATTQYYVPSVAERTGNFSADTGFTLYDPTQPFVNGQRSAVLSGNIIPQNYINPIGQYIVNEFPQPTANTPYNGTTPNYFGADDFKTRGDEYVGKLDHEFAQWWSASASYVHLATQEPGGDLFHTIAASDGVLTRYIDATAVNNVFTLNPTTLLTVGYGFSRYYSTTPQYSNGFNQETGFGGAGFPAGYVSQLQSKTFPTISLTGVTAASTLSSTTGATSLGAANSGPTIKSQRSFVVVIAKTEGKQNLKAGYLFRNFNQFTSLETTGNGSFTFDGQYTDQNGASVSNGPQAIADLLLGLPSSASVQINAVALNQNAQYHALYVQDDIRLTPKLTANAGLRYEYELGQRESTNRYNVGFDPNVAYSFAGANGTVPAHGAIAFAGLNGYPTHSGDLSHTKFSPRVGLSYEVRPGTVVHGGYGVFYAAVPLSSAATGFSQLTSYLPGNASGPVAVGANGWLSNPFGGQLLAPTGTSLGPLTGIGGAITVPAFHLGYPLVEQYSADVERQLSSHVVLKIGYVGAHGCNLANAVNINQIPDNVLAEYAPGGLHAGTNLSSKVANPYYAKTVGGLPSTPFGVIAQSTVPLGQTLLPFPQFGSITETLSNGHSLYNALDVKLQEQFSHGLTALIAYTWSSNWDNLWGSPVAGLNTLNPNPTTAGPQDNYNPEGEYSRATNDIPNRFTAAVMYDLPFGRGKSVLGNVNRFVDGVIGGWTVNDVTIVENGGALPIVQTNLSTGTFGTTGVAGANQRPNLVPGINPCYSGRPQSRLGGGGGARPYINLNAFTPALPYTFGDAPRTLDCYGPGYTNSDISLNKNFKVTERVNFKADVEALNAFNTPQFGQPGITLTLQPGGTLASAAFTSPASNATTGAITSQLGFSRIIQVGGRISF